MRRAELIAREGALMDQLTALLAEEQQWLARESAAQASPYNERRAAILAELGEIARERTESGPGRGTTDVAELRRRAERLEAANARNLAMVQERLRGLERALQRFGSEPDYGGPARTGARLGQG